MVPPTSNRPLGSASAPTRWALASTRWWIPALVLLTLAGFGWRAYRLEAPSLDYDEVYEVTHRTTDLGVLIGRTDGFPPLYRLLAAYAIELSGSAMAPRWLSALIGAATIPLVGLLGRRLAGPLAGVVAAALFAFSANHVLLSQHGRAYALVVFLTTAMLLTAWRLRASDRATDWLAFLVASWLAIATHYYAGILLVILGALLLIEKRGAGLRRAIVAAGLMTAAGLALVPCLRADLADKGEYFSRPSFDLESYAFGYLWLVTGNTLGPSVSALREMVAEGRKSEALAQMAPYAIAVAAVVGTLLAAGWRRLSPADRWWLAVLLVAPPLLVIAALPITHTGFNQRYVVWMGVPLFVWLGAGATAVGAWRWPAWGASLALLALGLIATWGRHFDPQYLEQDFHAVVALIEQREGSSDAAATPAVLAAPLYFGEAVVYSLPDGWLARTVTANPRTEQDWDTALPRFAELLGERDQAWLVTPWHPPSHPQHALCEELAKRLGATLVERVSSTVMVYRFPTERLR